MTERHWADIGEATFIGGIRAMLRVYQIFGRRLFRIVVYPVAFVYVWRTPIMRRASRAYLRRVAPRAAADAALGNPPGWWDSVRHVAAFAESILDRFRAWSGDVRLADLDFESVDVMDGALDSGKGGVVITAHLGSAEVCRALSDRRRGARLNVLVHTKHAGAFNAMLADLNPASGLNLVQVTEITPDVAVRLREAVDRGELIVIAGDRVPVSAESRVAEVDFLGAPARFPVGPYVLASILGCPAYLLFCVSRQGRFVVSFERFRDSVRLARGKRDAELAILARDFADRLAHHCSRAPLQWFNFYDFWSSPTPPPHNANR